MTHHTLRIVSGSLNGCFNQYHTVVAVESAFGNMESFCGEKSYKTMISVIFR